MTALGRRWRPAMQTATAHCFLLLLRRLDLRTGSATVRNGSACCLPRATFRPGERVIRYARRRHRQGARTGCATAQARGVYCLITGTLRHKQPATRRVNRRRHHHPLLLGRATSRNTSVCLLMTALGRRGRPAMQTAGHHRRLLLLRRLDLRTGSATIRNGSACYRPLALFRHKQPATRRVNRRRLRGIPIGCATPQTVSVSSVRMGT